MKKQKSVFYYCLMAGLALCANPSKAAIRVGNPARNNATGYQQLNEIKYGSKNLVATNESTVASIQNTQTQNIQSPHPHTQKSCQGVFSDGQFVMSTPTLGPGIGGAETCTATVEIRAANAAEDGSDLVVARANLPMGSGVRCNISDFPEATWLPAAATIEFPADNEPTVDDVIQVLNKEQKEDALLKIAAGTVIAGVAGNAIGENEPGQSGIFGIGKQKLKSTATTALGGALLMFGHTHSGKVAGDMILSAGVNATAGAVVGNIVATGNQILRFENCIIEGQTEQQRCLWGTYAEKGNDLKSSEFGLFYDTGLNRYYKCNFDAYENGEPVTFKDCIQIDLIGVQVDGTSSSIEDLSKKDFTDIPSYKRFTLDQNTDTVKKHDDGDLIKLNQASKVEKRKPAALLVDDDAEKTFGSKRSDWPAIKGGMQTPKIYLRNPSTGKLYQEPSANYSISQFVPLTEDADDGELIDFNNKARLKSTLTGAGVGGSLGAFSAYQGAQKDIDERWLAAVREYKDSLNKVYCVTGTHFLGYYNDTIIIPNMPE